MGAANGDVNKYVRNALSKYTVDMRRQNAIGPAALSPIGGMLGGMWCIIQPELFEIFADELLESGYQLDTLTEGVLTRGSVFKNEAFSGAFRRITIWQTSALPQPADPGTGTATAGNDKWTFYLGVPKAIAFSQVPGPVLLLSPAQNQTGPSWKLNQIVDYAVTILQLPLLRRVTIEDE